MGHAHDREEKEAERKRTEAAGIRDYNLIAHKVAPDLLRWRSIDATLELAKSQNTKVVVLGGGQSGTQMLMSLDAPAASPPAPAAAPAAPAPPAPGQQGPAAGPIAPRGEPVPAPPNP